MHWKKTGDELRRRESVVNKEAILAKMAFLIAKAHKYEPVMTNPS
jgi:hypothetical protein